MFMVLFYTFFSYGEQSRGKGCHFCWFWAGRVAGFLVYDFLLFFLSGRLKSWLLFWGVAGYHGFLNFVFFFRVLCFHIWGRIFFFFGGRWNENVDTLWTPICGSRRKRKKEEGEEAEGSYTHLHLVVVYVWSIHSWLPDSFTLDSLIHQLSHLPTY